MIILECPIGLNSSQTICVTFQNYYVNFQRTLNLTVYSNHFELDNGVMTTSKRHSFLAF